MKTYDKAFWDKLDKDMKDRAAKKKADAEMVETALANDPRVAHIPRSLRTIFLRDIKGEEREKMLAFYQRQADKKANQPKRFWEIWKR